MNNEEFLEKIKGLSRDELIKQADDRKWWLMYVALNRPEMVGSDMYNLTQERYDYLMQLIEKGDENNE